MINNRIQALFNPEQYHGWGRNKKYFEGWYFKLVNAKGDRSLAVIPGIAMDEKGNKQAFIQILDAEQKNSEYIYFEAADFKPQKGTFEVNILHNHFSEEEINLDLPNLKGKLKLENLVKWTSSLYSPGAMGPFAFMPKMECYHEIISLNHDLNGILKWKGETYDFTGGRGYLEKNWGHSFPSAYVWFQCNHFKNHTASLIGTFAKVPVIKSSFIGFVAGLWYEGKLIQFTTYNFSKMRQRKIDQEFVTVQYENKRYRLDICIKRDAGVELAAPIGGMMDARISETMTATLQVALFDKKKNNVVFKDEGTNSGLDIAGKIDEIQMG